MDGRNVGGSNSGGFGRPKLVRPGISLQRENAPLIGSGSIKSGQNVQTDPNEGDGGGMHKPHQDSSSLNPNISALSNPAHIGSSALSVQKSFASEGVPTKDIMDKAGADDKANQDIAKKSSSSDTASAEGTTKILSAAMPEGLSSLVSYSSSSAEASASEDNGQDDPYDLGLSTAPEKPGNLGEQTSEALVKKMQDIASLQECMERESVDLGPSKDTLDQGKILGHLELSRQPPKNMPPAIPDSKTENVVIEREKTSASLIREESQPTREKDLFSHSKQQAEMKPMKTEALGSLLMSQEHMKGSQLSKQDLQLGKVDASVGLPTKVVQGGLHLERTQVFLSEYEAMTAKAKTSSLFGEKEIPGNPMKTSDLRHPSTELQKVGLQPPRAQESGPQREISSGLGWNRGVEKAQVHIPMTTSKTLQEDKPTLPSKEIVQESSGSATLFGSTQNTKDFMESSALENMAQSTGVTETLLLSHKEVSQSSVMDVHVESAIKATDLLGDQSMPFDPIEEQLKLLTEGHPLCDLGSPDEGGMMSPSDMLVENILGTSSIGHQEEPKDECPKETEVQGELKPTSESGVLLEPQTIFGGQKEGNIAVEDIMPEKEDIAHVFKEAETKSEVFSASDKGMPTDVRDAEESMSAVEGNVCESLSSSSTSEEGKEAAVIAPVSEEQKEDLADSQMKKRGFSDDTSVEGVDQERDKPKEKRIKLEEKDAAASTPSEDQGREHVLVIPKIETEEMEIDTNTAPIEVLPTFENLSEDLASSQKLSGEEESKNDMDDSSRMSSPFKDNSEGKDKDDDKDDDNSAAARRRRKKKSYERPRGEGGKFRKERGRIDPSLLDEDTRMEGTMPMDEDSQGSSSKREVRRFRCEVIVPESTEVFTVEKVVEYVWPLEGCGEHYFIQEQISQYLSIMSFKRKYPDLRRRPLEMLERDFLKDKGLVSEMACDLGLTAVRSEDVLDVMMSDFPQKFEELQRLLRERKENEMKERGKVNYSMATLDKSKMQEYLVKAAEDSARWNAAFNREKKEDRRYSFDLQTCTVQMPRGRHRKLPSDMTKMGAYPVAVLPGQFTDYYRQYTPGALKSMPLNTVMGAPTTDALGSDGAGSDSEEETAVPLPVTAANVPDTVEPKDEKSEGLPRCKVCSGTKLRNKGGKPEPMIICGNCRSASHPTCIDLTLVMVPKIESYNWQCMDCKSCVTCSDPDDEDKMIFCDMCDRGYHIYCVGLRRVPNGRWHCKECAICSSCGSKTPAGSENAKNAEWQHEFKKDKNNKQLRYATTLCVPCDKYWKRRQFCYVCLKVYRSIPEDGMVRCSNCPKYIHREGCSTMYETERFCNNCYKIRNSTALNHSRIIAAAKKKMASGY